MKVSCFWRLVLLLAFSQAPILMAGEIRGFVENEAGHLLSGFQLILENNTGHQLSTSSDQFGNYSFKNLPGDTYELKLIPGPFQLVVFPECGSSTIVLQSSEIAIRDCKIVTAGVAVDFGRPTTTSEDPAEEDPKANPQGESFEFSVLLASRTPEQLTYVGFALDLELQIPGPPISLVIESIQIGTDYQIQREAQFSYTQRSGGRFSIDFFCEPPNKLNTQGEVLRLRGTIYSPTNRWLINQQNILCLCILNQEFYFTPGKNAPVTVAEPRSTCFEVANKTRY